MCHRVDAAAGIREEDNFHLATSTSSYLKTQRPQAQKASDSLFFLSNPVVCFSRVRRNAKTKLRGGAGGGYSFVACVSHLNFEDGSLFETERWSGGGVTRK